MSTFCRITGKSRGLPKPNYFPLLPPISPADAKRFCRITGKAYGLPSHHYIPVLVGRPKKSNAKKKSEEQSPNSLSHGKRHIILADFRYVFPSLDESPEMTRLLASKNIETPEKYVYPVEERRCNLVFPAKLEAAVRDGDVKDVMLAKDSDTVLLKLKFGGDVAVDVKDIDVTGMVLWEGEGPNEDVLKKRTKRKRAGSTTLVRKIFEDKERAADAELEEAERKRPRVKNVKLTSGKTSEPKKQKWNNFQEEKSPKVADNKVDEISNAVLEKPDWSKIGKEKGEILVSKLPDPMSVSPEQVNLGFSLPGIIQQPNTVSENIVGFEPVSAITPICPLVSEPDPVVQNTIKSLTPEQLSKTANVDKVFNKTDTAINLLPRIDEIPELITHIRDGVTAIEQKNGVKVQGLKVDIEAAQRFIVGQTVDTPQGPLFVPGQTVQTPVGEIFLPGVTVQTPDGARLLPGQCVKVDDEKGNKKEVFVAGQSVMTRKGEMFVQGQSLMTSEGVKFVPGQTVITGDAPRFVPGQILLGDKPDDTRFIPGQTEITQNGPQFVPGQTIISSGAVQFIAGQSVHSDDGWDFVPGKSITTAEGEMQFLPGREISTKDGKLFIPGQYGNDKNDNIQFVPGVTSNKEVVGTTFLPGITMDTPEGKQFVEGQIMKTNSGTMKFVPGTSNVSENGTISFAAARSLNEVVFHKELSSGLIINEQYVNADEKMNAVYGHMVQTEKGVEFFPGVASGLPAGKVVPGKLVRGDEVRFIPGIVIDGNFVPGQIVMTDQGEQFVPGQVVETENGPKFVPGQVIDSGTGPKFVPGQTINTEDGPKFVPGQIVETRAGPTFIPGQIISTDEEGSRFVPGQVVDTVEGPRFVPGRVIETGDHVTFIPGQVVQTSEGLRFVAPDLQNSEEGECEFTVQSYQVTPEELNLLQLQAGTTTHFTSGQTAIDSRMMRQLSQAGMAVGRQVPAEVPVVDIRSIPAMSTACELSERLKLDPVSTIKLSQLMTSIAQFNCDLTILETVVCSPEEITLLKELLAVVMNADNDVEMYKSIGEIIENKLKLGGTNTVPVLDKLHTFIVTSSDLTDLRKPSTLNVLREIIKNGSKENKTAIDKLSSVLKTNEETISSAFRHLSEGRPELIKTVVQKISENVSSVDSEKEAFETLQRAIVNTVRETSEISVQELIHDSETSGLKNLIVQAVGLARALGLIDVASALLEILSDPKCTEVLSGDSTTLAILRRLTVMRQLAEKRPTFMSALGQLQSDPELARTNPLLRELVRESAALMVVPEEAPILESSADIPASLFHQPGSLAMEDYLVRTQRQGILLIIKDGLQMVVPREASRLVLTGQVPYTVLDEKGIQHFAPLHVFNALRLPNPAQHHFSMYACKMEQDETEEGTLTPVSSNSLEDLRRLSLLTGLPAQPNGRSTLAKKEFNEDRELYIAKQDYTPIGSDRDSIALRKGEKVILLRTEQIDNSSKKPRLDPDLDLGETESSGPPLLDNAAAKHKMSIRPKRKHADSRQQRNNATADERWFVQSIDEPSHQGWVPANVLTIHEDSPEGPNEAKYRREAVIRELVETEEEFGRDILQVVDHYLKPLDSKSVPSIVRENKELIFGNLKQIAELHNSVLIEGVKYYANEPRMLGKTFIRLERDFDKHVAYCRDEPAAQEFLQEHDNVRDFFEEVSQRLGDDKSLSEHLKLPIQRINDYQLLLKELVKYSNVLGEDTTDLGKALELMLAVPHRANDNKFISNIEGYHGNIHKLGRLLRHDWFSVTDCEGKSKDRYLFLFKARILICKVRRISEDRFVFVLKDIIRLPEVEVKDHKDSDKVFELHHKQPGYSSYPLTISAHKERVKNAWLTEIRQYASDLLALAEHAADDLRLQAQPEDKKNIEPLTGIQLEPATPGQELPIERLSDEQNKENIIPQLLNKAAKFKESNKRKEEDENKETTNEKKLKTDQQSTEGDDMDRFSSSRKSVSSRRVEEFRSVSSTTSQEIYVETSSARHQMSSSTSSSRNMKMVEESASVNGQTVSQFREVTGDVDGFSSIHEAAAGTRGGGSYATIEEVTSGSRGSVDYSSAKRGSKDLTSTRAIEASKDKSSSSSKPVFARTISGTSTNVGEKAVFECEVDENTRVIWLKDNKPLALEGQSDRFTIVSTDTSHRLEINDIKDSDAGIYTARAYNVLSKSTSSCTAQLAIDKKETEEMKLEEHAPFFIVHLKDTELLENTYLRFMIKVKGSPNPDVKFYKDDSLITSVNPRVSIVKDNAEKGFYEMVINGVQQEDAGKYKCVASNSHGEVECEAVVTVSDEKKLFEGLEDSELLAPGETPKFMWLRDGKPFDPEERFKVLFKDEEDSLALVFQHVKPEDVGLYTCVASTSTGKISCSAELTVQGTVNQLMREPERPKITTEIKTQEASVGGSAMLELKIEGFPKPEIKWTKGDKEIKADSRHKILYEDDESMSLVIKGVTTEDAGDYKIQAINDLGDDSDVIHLTVKAPPKFKRKLSDIETMAGQEIRLSVDIEGSPKPNVQWYKDGLLIKKSDRVKTIEDESTEYTLFIEKSTLDDGGQYSVVATNEISQCSEFCKVQVHSPPQFIKGMAKSIETKEGDNVSFQVKVKGDPAPSVKWLHNGKELQSDAKHVKVTQDGELHTLTLSGIARGDAGKYTCELTNQHGKNTESGDLNVRCSPQFRTKLSDMKANEGDTNVEFTVNVEAFPRPNVQWFHDEVEITEKVTEFTRVEEGDNYKLIIKEVTKELSGKYTCKVVNDLGENTTSSTLTVYSKPKFRKGLKDVQVDEGASLTLQVEIEGTPDPTVKWFKNGEEVTGDAHIKISRDSKRVENYSMTFTLVKPEDGGEYEVRASNEMGTTVSQSTVTVHTKTSHTENNELVEEKLIKEEKEDVEQNKDDSLKKTIEDDLHKESKKADETEGLKPLKVTAEDLEEEEAKDVFVTDKEQPEGFSCVEVKFDETEAENPSLTDLQGSNSGVIEEYSDTEDKRMPVSRGVSIISMSEEETKQSMTPDDERLASKEAFIFETETIPEISPEKQSVISGDNKLLGDKKGKRLSIEEQEIIENSKSQSIDEETDISDNLKPRKASKFDLNEKDDEIPDTKKMNGDINGYGEDLRRGSKAEIAELKRSDSVKDKSQKISYEDMNGDDDKLKKGKLLSKESAEGLNGKPETDTNVSDDQNSDKPSKGKYSRENSSTVNERRSSESQSVKTGLVNGDIKQKGKQDSIDDEELDPQVAELLKRVQKQRSVLEEILDKEGERAAEAFPQILSAEMESKSVFETLPTYFQVNAIGNPRPDVKWYKDEKPIEPSQHFKIIDDGDKHKLEIDSVKKDDSGNYKCVVSNRMGEKAQEATLTVNPENELRGPKVKLPLKDTKIPKLESGELVAVFTADPEPEIKWSHDGDEVDASFVLNKKVKPLENGLVECEYTLQIPAGKHEDTGTYKIEATNKFGSDESSARLDIILRPEILVFKDATVAPHEETELIAVIIANPKPKVSWSFEEKTIKDDNRRKIVSDDVKETYKLQLTGAGKGDEGVYKITASNSAGETIAEARINVHTEPPSFVKKLEDQSIREYALAEFKVRVNGVPKPEISWFRDGKELKSGVDGVTIETVVEGQVSSTLTIEHLAAGHEGSYTVKAVNMAGEAESSAKLKMAQVAPNFLKPLDRSTDVCETEPLELKAKIEGSPLPQVKWFKDGEELPGDDRIKLSVTPDGNIKLSIDSVTPGDSGQYKLVAVNPNGETTGVCAVIVNPAPKKPIFIKELSDTKGVEGEPLSLDALIDGYPEPKVKWTKDGHPIRPTQSLSFVKTPSGQLGLEIDYVKPEDAGTYSVTISNKLGEETSQAQVDVSQKEKKPQFLSHLMPANVVEGFPAKMEVKVTGHPKPELTWALNGKPIVPDGQHIKIVSGPDGSECLVIDKATPEDAGEYSVTAKNGQGEVTTKAPLSVASKCKNDEPEEKPAFVKELRDTFTDEGTPLLFSAPIIGNPIPDVEWEKDGEKLEPSDRIQITCDGNKVGLEINPSKLSDAGSYKCKLSNPLGQAESSAKGNVKKIYQAPEFTQRFTDTQQIPSYDAKFLARISGVPKPDVSWYKDGKQINDNHKYRIKQDGDSHCLYVKDVTPDDAGRFKCRATNREGEATCEAQLQVVDKIEKSQKMEPPAFLKKIGDCEVYKGMTAKFTACATGYPEPEVEWYRGEDKLYPSERIRMEKEGTGLLRLSIIGVDPDVDIGKYRCRIFNPHGEDSCEASIVYDTLDIRPRKPIGDQYTDFEKYRSTGAPLPLSDPPIISRMTDRKLTLSWKPSIPHGPRDPVTYLVEMCELPDGEWFTARRGIRSCVCDIHNLQPFRDYKFRIRVENKYGTSDPSPFALTHRARLEPEPPKFQPYLPPGVDFHPDTSPYFPKDFDIERPPHDKNAQAPRFLRQEDDTQYGVKGHNCNLFWFVYGYPKPKMQYFFNDELIEMGGRYDASYTRNGQATLFINKMLDRDVGTYEAVATNEHGQARQRVRLEIAEYPHFIQRPDETIIMTRKSGRLIARVTGVPYPEIKWFKDWQPLASSSRVKIQFIEPDQCILTINDAMTRDEGLYSISAGNIAGSISSSVMVRVEENEAEYGYLNYDKSRNVKPKTKPITDKYDLGDELGRGTQGITYHAVERSTGRNYAAKVMHGKGHLRALMRNELDIMNQLNHRKLIRLQDAFEDPTKFTLVMELAGGGELLESLTKQTFTTESEIASYIRQVLWGLEHMHDQNIAHLGLTPGDLLISHAGGDDLRICDFGLSRRIPFGKHASLEYGMPEYVSPEIVKGDGVGTPADMWALGIITHVLLTGISIFKGKNDMETLNNVKESKWSFQEDIWSSLSTEARDFITRLLIIQPEGRMDVKEALRHPWLNLADKIPPNEYNITTDSLRNYYNSLKDWYGNASCRKWYRLQPLSGAYTHPSRMVYPPGHIYTPENTPDRYIKDKEPKQPRTWEDQIPSREPIDYELGIAKSESHYQNGPDTYLLQLRDVDFPVRLREYMKVAANRTPSGLGFTRESLEQQPHIDWRAPVIRERRRFTDIMDEEIDDERKARINRYGSADTYTLRRLRNEIGTRLDAHVEAEALIESKRDGHAPFFREKPQITPIREEQTAELACLAVGEPKPTVQWFKNDLVIGESNRIKIIEDEFGRSILRLQPALSIDAGIYKVVARNKVGQTVARTRLVMATVPGAPDSPEVSEISDTEVLLRWKLPRDDGNSPILCYNLQYKEAESVEWTDVASNIDHEFWVVRNLRPNTSHQFRLAARNNLGWSAKGIPTETVKTKEAGAAKIAVTSAMKLYQSASESGQEIKAEEPALQTQLDYTIESSPIEWKTEQPTEKYNFISEIHRGQFSVVVKGINKSTEEVVVGKLLEWRPDTEEQVSREFEVLRSLRHERIASLIEAFRPSGSTVAVFIEEKLQGADILTYLSSRHEYTEQMVATVITQLLDALHYLHWRGYCHLDVQPDNIVMASIRSVQIKLVDVGSAQRVSKLGTGVKKTGSLEFSAPEVLCDEPAFPQSDIWSVGVLAYVLLSGASPFLGANNEETRQNINFVRFRFEHLYKELTQEATRFIMLIFKRTPSKRPTAEESHEHRWLLPTEYMIKRRERAVFLGNRLKEFSDKYHSKRSEEATQWDPMSNAVVGRGALARSNSIQEELLINF